MRSCLACRAKTTFIFYNCTVFSLKCGTVWLYLRRISCRQFIITFLGQNTRSAFSTERWYRNVQGAWLGEINITIEQTGPHLGALGFVSTTCRYHGNRPHIYLYTTRNVYVTSHIRCRHVSITIKSDSLKVLSISFIQTRHYSPLSFQLHLYTASIMYTTRPFFQLSSNRVS